MRRSFERKFGSWLRAWSIRPRLVAVFLLVSIFPVILIGVITSLSFSRALDGQVAAYSSQLVAQVAKNMAETFDRMVALSENLIVHPVIQDGLKSKPNLTAMEKRTLYVRMDAELSRLIYRNAKVHDVNIYRVDGTILLDTGYSLYRETDQARILEGIAQSQQNMYWTAITTARGIRLIVVGRNVYDVDDTKRVIGSLAIMLDERSFARNAYYGVDMGTDSDLLLVNREGTIISSAQGGELPGSRLNDHDLVAKLAAVEDELPNSFSWTTKAGTSLVSVTAVPQTDWVLMARIPDRVLENLSRQLARNIGLVCLGVILLVSFLGSVLFFSIQSPLERLVKATDAIQRGDFTNRIDDHSEDEVGRVSRAMDDMAHRLGGLVDEIQLQQEDKRRVELEVLQSQINPHFLFNTLDALKWTAMLHGNEQVGAGIGALSSLLRNGVLAPGDSLSIDEELKNLASYALILKLRYGDSFVLAFDVDPELGECRLPKLLLQPFVENAILHGGPDESGTPVNVRVTGLREGVTLVIRIEDDGRGFDPRTTNQTNDRFSGIGVENVKERIRLWYGDLGRLTMESWPNQGTRVEIRLPVQRPSQPGREA